jgi:hypothetical protein
VVCLVLRRTDARGGRVFSRLWIVTSRRQWNEGSKTGGIAGSGSKMLLLRME